MRLGGTRSIVAESQTQFPSAVRQFLSVGQTTIETSHAALFGIIVAIISGTIIYLFTNSAISGSLLVDYPKRKIVSWGKFKPSRDEYFRDVVSSVVVVLLLSAVVGAFCYFVRSMFRDVVTLLFVFADIGILSTGVWLYVFYDAEKKRRRDFLVNVHLQLAELQFELERLKEFFHLLTWGLITIILAGLAAGIQYLYTLPEETSSSGTFRVGTLYPIGFIVFLLVVGYGGAILNQVFMQMGDLLDAIRDYDTKLRDNTALNPQGFCELL